ncbi:MAG: dihydropteroate synthase [Planctomycetes bacterium]|nr:dihydropteroate synthase [Planctomycetota bacterium]
MKISISDLQTDIRYNVRMFPPTSLSHFSAFFSESVGEAILSAHEALVFLVDGLSDEQVAALGDVGKNLRAYIHTVVTEEGHVSTGLLVRLSDFQNYLKNLSDASPTLPGLSESIWRTYLASRRDHFQIGDADSKMHLSMYKPRIMGIVNVTPDSFSDGGQFEDTDVAIEHALTLAAAGADIIDIGGESTRPGAGEVDQDEELRRVVEVVRGVTMHSDVPVSIDTRKASVARACVEAGAKIINDVSGLAFDPEMKRVVAETGALCIIMHMRETPETMQKDPYYACVIAEVVRELRIRILDAIEAGVQFDRIIVDPGIGFSKTLEHNRILIARLGELRCLSAPIAVGVSRKSFIGAITSQGVENRLMGTIAAETLAVMHGASIIRTHDVTSTRMALSVATSVLGSLEPKRQYNT